jgi:hypothetical protein
VLQGEYVISIYKLLRLHVLLNIGYCFQGDECVIYFQENVFIHPLFITVLTITKLVQDVPRNPLLRIKDAVHDRLV